MSFHKKSVRKRSSFNKTAVLADFFTYIAYHFPYVFGKAFNQKYDKIK